MLSDFVEMYAARQQIVLEDYKPRFVKVAIACNLSDCSHVRIEPDMPIQYATREILLSQCNTQLPGVGGAMALFDSADESIPFCLIYPDGDMLTTLVGKKSLCDSDSD